MAKLDKLPLMGRERATMVLRLPKDDGLWALVIEERDFYIFPGGGRESHVEVKPKTAVSGPTMYWTHAKASSRVEPSKDAAIRELGEETGLNLNKLALSEPKLLTALFPSPDVYYTSLGSISKAAEGLTYKLVRNKLRHHLELIKEALGWSIYCRTSLDKIFEATLADFDESDHEFVRNSRKFVNLLEMNPENFGRGHGHIVRYYQKLASGAISEFPGWIEEGDEPPLKRQAIR